MAKNEAHHKENENVDSSELDSYTMESSVVQLQTWLTSLSGTQLAEWDRLTDIGLYMDQILTLMDRQLAFYRRSEEDKLLTPAMVNNYTKDGLLPRATDKKYAQGHLALLSILCSLKPVLSISDLSVLSKNAHLQKDDREIYEYFLRVQEAALENSRTDLAPLLTELAETSFPAETSQDAYRQELALMALRMAVEARVRIMMTQKILDLLQPPETKKS
jgi:hypothetical protein